jgi:hypothetical protein
VPVRAITLKRNSLAVAACAVGHCRLRMQGQNGRGAGGEDLGQSREDEKFLHSRRLSALSGCRRGKPSWTYLLLFLEGRGNIVRLTPLLLCRSIFLLLRHSTKRGGESHAKTHDDFDCSDVRAGNDGHDGQRANPSAGFGELPRAASERDAVRQTGGM